MYYDTDALGLAANQVILRRRTGGEDDGWHVKLPKSSGERLEVHHPLGRSFRKVPIQWCGRSGSTSATTNSSRS